MHAEDKPRDVLRIRKTGMPEMNVILYLYKNKQRFWSAVRMTSNERVRIIAEDKPLWG